LSLMRASSVVNRQLTPRPARLRAACHAATSRCRVARSASRLTSAGGNAAYSDAGRVGVEVVLDQHDLLGVGVVDVDQVLDGSAPSRCGCAGR
jgi:hypothetical protein